MAWRHPRLAIGLRTITPTWADCSVMSHFSRVRRWRQRRSTYTNNDILGVHILVHARVWPQADVLLCERKCSRLIEASREIWWACHWFFSCRPTHDYAGSGLRQTSCYVNANVHA